MKELRQNYITATMKHSCRRREKADGGRGGGGAVVLTSADINAPTIAFFLGSCEHVHAETTWPCQLAEKGGALLAEDDPKGRNAVGS